MGCDDVLFEHCWEEAKASEMKPEFVFTLENADWPALLVDESATVRKASLGAKNIFGKSMEAAPTLGGSIWAKENDTTAEEFFARWSRQPVSQVALRFRMKDGTIDAYNTFITPLPTENGKFFVLQLFQLNANTTVETLAAAQKQKLDCALQLTRTVALDFNNALTTILGHTSLLLSKLESAHPWRTSLVEIEKSAEKAAEIAHDLAAFSRQEKDVKAQQAGNLNELVVRTVDLFRNANHEGVFWNLELQDRLYTVQFDEAKMQQALVKILENAIQAVNNFGRVAVNTTNHEFTEPFQDGPVRLAPGNYVCVEVRDSGTGIAPEVLPRIFEPFFTTKNSPQHRGLGLAWVYGIVTNHGGSVAVSSQVGEGTSARVYLPAQRKVVKDSTHKVGDLTGSQTILMIDDEDLLLTMGETVLSSYGYRVLTANSGQKGLDLFQRCAGEIDLVITDLVMPQMSGRELVEKLRAHSPEVKIICSSGFVRSGIDEDETYLQKPFTSQDLLRKVKSATAGTN
jgi:two-component system cell cycle sensor histidine kinase/response regulator CckA